MPAPAFRISSLHHFRFPEPGGSYGADITVEIRLKDGSTMQHQIADPSKRYD